MRGRQKWGLEWTREWKRMAVLAWSVFFVIFLPISVRAAESLERAAPTEAFPVQEDSDESGWMPDWSELNDFLRRETDTGVSFGELMETLLGGDGRAAGRMILDGVHRALFSELSHGSKMAGQLLALGLVGAVFAGFSEIFSSTQISETGFFMTYLLAFTALAAGFSDSMAVTGEVLEKQIEFLRVLLPAYFMAVAWAGGHLSSIAWYEVMLFLIGAVQWLYQSLLIPAARVYILLVMAGHISKENMMSRLTEMLRGGMRWATRSLIGLVLGFQLIQGLVLPYADSVRSGGVQKLLQAIPGIGSGAGAVSKIVLGSGVLIKNTAGAAGIFILVMLSVLPVMKLLILLFLYRAVAAVMEPVCDKRLVACISSVADGQQMLVEITVCSLVLFVVTIALICAGTNVSYLA